MLRHNYFPNPAGLSSRMQPSELIDCTFRDWNAPGVTGFALTSSTEYGSYAAWDLTQLPAGSSLALLAKVGSAAAEDKYRGAILETRDSSGTILAQSETWASNKLLRVAFTVPANGKITVVFRGRQGVNVVTAFYNTRITETSEDESFFNSTDQVLVFGGGA
ncbi:hypothetical protein [Bifidobacterium biavatii]|uniref:Uncharacterized protein n=1 Tax=Bifidobacterium biavatii DSM 23969 TaxID=1437608 RepID=A0A086ZU01_9BIFI|nr:hypothetical protein [Bifidobacterium biavatii]KFI50001.1 hypothetical protein BBIA_2134 [Bifidobacterium biavatii DSM 23969]